MRNFKLLNRILAVDETARALQLSGIIRFSIVLIQGIVLVKMGLDPVLIAVVESFYFLFNLSRFYFLSGGKYSGFSRLKSDSYSYSAIFWGFNVIGIAAALVTVFLSVVGATDFSSFLNLDYVSWALPILVLFSLPVDTYDLYYVKNKRPNAIVNYTLLIGVVQAAGLIYFLLNDFHMGYVVLYFLAVYVVRWFHLLLTSSARHYFPIELATSFAVFALPLILHALFSGLTDYVDGWLIKAYFSESDFAVFRYGARELPLNSILIGAVVSGLILIKTDVASEVRNEIGRMLSLLTPILAILILLSPWLFEYFYSADYRFSAMYFNLYALLILSRIVFVQVFYYRADDRWLLSGLSLAEVICNVGLSLVLLRSFGVLGIPVATLVVDFFFRAMLVIVVQKRYNISFSSYYPIKRHLGSSLVLCFCFVISYLIYFH